MKSFDALYGEIQALPEGQRGEILTPGEVFVTMGRPGRRHRWATQSLYANLLERDAKVGGTGWWIEIDHRAHDRGRRGEHHSAAVRSQARRPPPLGHRRETERNGIVFSVRTWKSSPPTRWSHKMVPQDADVRRAIDGKALKKNLKIGGSVPGLECPVLHHGRA
jgi:hypothetical protein